MPIVRTPPPPSAPQEPASTRIANSFKQLAASATKLHQATNEFSQVTAPIDDLLKQLNLGVECWVRVNKWSGDEGTATIHEIGYTKVSGQWGVALRSFDVGVMGDREHDELWRFNDGPRMMRLDAVEKLPDLLEELVKKADKFTRQMQEGTQTASHVIAALHAAADSAGLTTPTKGASP